MHSVVGGRASCRRACSARPGWSWYSTERRTSRRWATPRVGSASRCCTGCCNHNLVAVVTFCEYCGTSASRTRTGTGRRSVSSPPTRQPAFILRRIHWVLQRVLCTVLPSPVPLAGCSPGVIFSDISHASARLRPRPLLFPQDGEMFTVVISRVWEEALYLARHDATILWTRRVPRNTLPQGRQRASWNIERRGAQRAALGPVFD